jgi:hypothetical protein
MKQRFSREFIVKKGQEKYKVWKRANDILYDFMINNNPVWHGGKNPTKKDIKVKIEVHF